MTTSQQALTHLADAGWATDDAIVTTVAAGPLLTRLAVTGGAGSAWIDLMNAGHSRPVDQRSDEPTGASGVIVPRRRQFRGPGLFGAWWPVPWQPRLVATQGLPAGSDFATITHSAEALGLALGGFFTKLHHEKAWINAAVPSSVHRLQQATGLAAQPRWRRLLAELSRGARSVRLHGEPASGHLLIPNAWPPPAEAPLAALLGWGPRCGGDPALDVGHLVGDLIELANLLPVDRVRSLAVCGQALLSSYDVCGDTTFCDRAQAWASLAVVDHAARLELSGVLPPHHPAMDQLDSLARGLIDAPGLSAVLADLAGGERYAIDPSGHP